MRVHLPREPEDPNVTLVDDAFCAALVTDYLDILDRLATRAGSEVDWHIPCSLFHRDQQVPGFSVGPVDFRSRACWIDRFVTDTATRAHVLEVETGVLRMNERRKTVYFYLRGIAGDRIRTAARASANYLTFQPFQSTHRGASWRILVYYTSVMVDIGVKMLARRLSGPASP